MSDDRRRRTSPRRLVLASTSPYRRALLERLGLAFDAVSPDGVDEQAALRSDAPPEAIARQLARAKAESLAQRFPDALLIGADQIAVAPSSGGQPERLLGKPGTVEHAIEQLAELSGRTHRLLTAVAVHDPTSGRSLDALDVHEITLRALSRETLRRYVLHDMPLDCAGAYRIERLGVALMERIRGDDFTAVIGLPLTRLVHLLAEFGFEVIEAATGPSGANREP
ncbi:MAG: septum formation protein Maf [Planctomycetota bacterium]|nr:MAG: septum formation protein Maf [Planctomycetota bacterium]